MRRTALLTSAVVVAVAVAVAATQGVDSTSDSDPVSAVSNTTTIAIGPPSSDTSVSPSAPSSILPETGVPGRSGSLYAVPLESPPCQATISTAADWSNINDPAIDVWCVEAGDYRAAGVIGLETSGSASTPRWIRYVSSVHPARRADQAIVIGFTMNDADYWVIQGLNQRGGADNTEIRAGSEHNVFDRMLMEGGTNFGQWELLHGAHNNTLQNSVLRSTIPQANRDNGCVLLNGSNHGRAAQILNTRIVNNEIYDCSADSVGLSRPSQYLIPVDFSGTIIDDNDLYLTAARWAGADTACAENAVDVKAGGTANSPVVISNNRMWGFRETDEGCGGTGSRGEAVVVHQGAQHVSIVGNIIWDVDRGLSLSDDGIADGHIADTGFVAVIDNVIWSVSNEVNPTQGSGLRLDSTTVTVRGNTVTAADAWGDLGGDHHVISCNAFVDSGEARGTPGSDVTFLSNGWLDTPSISGPSDVTAVPTTVPVTIRRWTGESMLDIPAAEDVC